MVEITQRRVATNGIELNIAEAGDGPLVLMCHGFPESWYSWRYQFAPMAEASFHAVAPDMRGYGKSDKPRAITAYNQVEVQKDIVGLVSALGYDKAIVLGHDWGAPTAWGCARDYPDVFTAVGCLSVPYMPRAPLPPMQLMREAFKDQFFYQLYFYDEGVAEAAFEADIEIAMRKFLHFASAEMDWSQMPLKGPNDDLLTGIPYPEVLPDWLSQADLDFYVGEFERSGMRGPLNYYRNHDLTWELTKDSPTTIEQPAMFAAGDKDGVIVFAAEALQAMPTYVKDLRINELIPGAGHWTQQEAPEATTALIMKFLNEVRG